VPFGGVGGGGAGGGVVIRGSGRSRSCRSGTSSGGGGGGSTSSSGRRIANLHDDAPPTLHRLSDKLLATDPRTVREEVDLHRCGIGIPRRGVLVVVGAGVGRWRSGLIGFVPFVARARWQDGVFFFFFVADFDNITTIDIAKQRRATNDGAIEKDAGLSLRGCLIPGRRVVFVVGACFNVTGVDGEVPFVVAAVGGCRCGAFGCVDCR